MTHKIMGMVGGLVVGVILYVTSMTHVKHIMLIDAVEVGIFGNLIVKGVDQSVQQEITKTLHDIQDYSEVHLTLSSGGGYSLHMFGSLYTLEQIKKHVPLTVSVPSNCASACAVIMLEANTLDINPDAEVLFHLPRAIEGTTIVVLTPDHPNPEIRRIGLQAQVLYQRLLRPYLTHNEWKRLMVGEDITFTGKEFQERWNYVHKIKSAIELA